MIIGLLENGNKCVYDLPTEIKTAAEFGDSALRYFIEQGIIAAEISKEKEAI